MQRAGTCSCSTTLRSMEVAHEQRERRADLFNPGATGRHLACCSVPLTDHVRRIIPLYAAAKTLESRLPSQQEATKRRETFYRSLGVRPGDLCFDVGANTGNRVRPLLNIGATVVAMEPQPFCLRALRWQFGHHDRLTILPLGASDHDGEMELFVSNQHVLSSLSRDHVEDALATRRYEGATWDNTVTVRVTTLAAVARLFGVPAFIKIDVEGYESTVLKGMDFVPRVLSFEFDSNHPERVEACLAEIRRVGSFEFNVGIGEEMRFASASWVTAGEVRDLVKDGWGDVYARTV